MIASNDRIERNRRVLARVLAAEHGCTVEDARRLLLEVGSEPGASAILAVAKRAGLSWERALHLLRGDCVPVPRVIWERHCRLRRAAFAHHGKSEMLKATWALAQDDAVEEWIDASEELPEPDVEVLVVSGNTRSVAHWNGKCWVRLGEETSLCVSWWMPLPELPDSPLKAGIGSSP